ncbi:MAG: type II secretion system protein GspM [Proteobacteria bacterium]|nr:type II secretion system protein GspM [Pseudomonadota bacterium]
MKQQWLVYAARFNALARRERAMLAAAVMVGLAMLGYTFLVEPNLLRYENQTKTLAKVGTELKTIEAQLMVTQAQLKDPDAVNRNALLQSRKDLGILDAKLRETESSMVPPEKMQTFLESLLSKNRNLELLALNTLPPKPLIERVDEKKNDGKAGTTPVPTGKPPPNIYKHGIEIRIAGSYNDLLMYLAEIERMPQRIIWNRVRLSTERYPRNEMSLTVYTLSLDTQWLVV